MAPSASAATEDISMGNSEVVVNTNGSSEPLTMLRPMEEPREKCEVCIVGAGPAGLMLAVNLARFGIKPILLDERHDQTTVGRADGLQPKTIETLRMLRMGDEILRLGTKVYDICLWRGRRGAELQRMGREVHYPAFIVDVLEPFILLCHQGMVEGLFLDDLRKRGVTVKRSHKFTGYSTRGDGQSGSMLVHSKFNVTQDDRTLEADYIIGCDGAHSAVKAAVPETATPASSRHEASVWGVLDGEVDSDFPDIWSKTVVFSEEFGSILIIPRERNMTRFYIEMKAATTARELGQSFVMKRASQILDPYRISWRSVEWFGRYTVRQGVANAFSDPHLRVFIAGDASHTHSPKAAQGMNTSMHDSWNLGWKLNLAIRGLAKPVLLQSYEQERKKIAHDLINFDYEHANQIAGGDAAALAENFRTNVRFISGVGVEYSANILNTGHESAQLGGGAKPGCNPPPAKVSRYIDANPVDIQLDIPILGQFRVYIFMPDILGADEAAFLSALCGAVAEPSSLISRLSGAAYQSYLKKPRLPSSEDVYIRPERYTAVSQLYTFSLITMADKSQFEISSLPLILAKSPWTIYLDDVPQLDTRGSTCTGKWLGDIRPGQAAIVNVRPDGYVGSVQRFDASGATGLEAAKWLDSYYDGFLQAP
ncbi:FAD binding domain-containing protein [Pleurostoma richardsiae]|uniref:FAD binding domain-containing protein n=1 Tax=Pleurostoma richardsiae TaxID=41990 RepID=A0AA38VQE0_9PEZI|nr:FAD binding domain-containing protein [Pleurostoma richardsiae]